jgi:hypothetical protein
MKSIAPLAFVVLMATAAMHLTIAVAASSGRSTEGVKADGSVKVTVNYKGKGTVDGTHRLWVWLFASPDIGPGSMPIAETSIETNGAVATFDGIGDERVWIAAAFDEHGTMAGSAPPPSGTPVGLYVGSDGAPRSVVPGDSTVAVLTFDDSFRMP